MLEFDLEAYKNDLKNTVPEERENLKESIKAKYNRTSHILTGEKAQNYLNDMKIAQKFASENRRKMIEKMLEFFGYRF